MKKSTKALLLTLCAVALVIGSLVGTLAYLTDSEAVTNTFTVGQVHIKLDEADVKPDGTLDTANRVQENEYHLLPGQTYIKDPTIYVSKDSEECFLFVKVDNGIEAIETKDETKTIAGQMNALGWKPLKIGEEVVKDVYVLDKDGKGVYTVFKGAEVVVFNNFTIDGDSVDGAKLDAYKDAEIKVTAYAIQAAGFSTAAEAWAAAKLLG